MRWTTFTVIFGLLSFPAQSADFEIVGEWRVRDAVYPVDLIFHQDGTFEYDSPGVVLRAECTYTFDSSGSPSELILRCLNETKEGESRFWVDILSKSAIHFRDQNLDGPITDLEKLVDFTLDKVAE